MKVIKKTSTINFIVAFSGVAGKTLLDISVDNKMIATLMKLLVINIVANKPRGFFSSASVVMACLSFFSAMDSLSEGVNEKNATSAPETSAEQANKTIKISTIKARGQMSSQETEARTGVKLVSNRLLFRN